MPIPFRTNFAARAKVLINGAGESITYNKITKGAYNNTTHTVSDTKTPYVLLSYMDELNWTEKQDPNLVANRSQVFMIASLDLPVEPVMGDEIVGPDYTYTVKRVMAQRYGAGVAYWRVVGQRA